MRASSVDGKIVSQDNLHTRLDLPVFTADINGVEKKDKQISPWERDRRVEGRRAPSRLGLTLCICRRELGVIQNLLS